MDGASREVSRRDFFRGGFFKPHEKPSGWHKVEELAAGSGDVFWDGWADDAGVFIVGDDGAIFHFDGAAWTRQITPAPVPIHALWGLSRTNLWAVGWMGLILHYDGETWRKVQGCATRQGRQVHRCRPRQRAAIRHRRAFRRARLGGWRPREDPSFRRRRLAA